MFTASHQNMVRLPLGAYLPIIAASLLMLTLSRLGLCLWQRELLPPHSLSFILGMGLRYDIACICALFGLPVLLTLLLSAVKFLPRFILWVVKIWCAAAFAFLVMNEAATPGFILEYGVRPNQLYVQYLIYPAEVLKTLWGGHKLELFASIVITAAAFALGLYLMQRAFRRAERREQVQGVITLKRVLIELICVVLIVPLGIRSTLGHRPLNPAMAAFCDSPLVNSLPVNSSYSAAYALAHLGDTKLKEDAIYKLLSEAEVLQQIKTLSVEDDTDFPGVKLDEACPLNQDIRPLSPDLAPLNVVIVLEESMGADFVKSLGGLPLTPELERLKQKGWWFENMYAAGHRSIRGIEAVTAGFPPSPLESIVKLPTKYGATAMLGEVYRAMGYHTSFIYGGESHFDNMRQFFLDNGMQHVIDQNDYSKPRFVASWGVSDEDLFARAHEIFERESRQGNNFFSVVFTSSFHDPFEIPEGKVAITEPGVPDEPRYRAVKYADYALGRFMDAALSSNYAANTVFLLIADHESRVRGSGIFPLWEFKIPALIIAPQQIVRSDPRIVSQMDMAPTLLALSGFKGSVPYAGQNLLRDDIRERAPMQFNNMFGLLDKDGFVVLTPGREPDYYRVGEHDELTAAGPAPEDKVREAEAVSNLGPLIYNHGYMQKECIRFAR